MTNEAAVQVSTDFIRMVFSKCVNKSLIRQCSKLLSQWLLVIYLDSSEIGCWLYPNKLDRQCGTKSSDPFLEFCLTQTQ